MRYETNEAIQAWWHVDAKTVSTWRNVLGLPSPGGMKRSIARDKKLRKEYGRVPTSVLAQEMGLSVFTVNRWAHRLGLPVAPVGRPRRTMALVPVPPARALSLQALAPVARQRPILARRPRTAPVAAPASPAPVALPVPPAPPAPPAPSAPPPPPESTQRRGWMTLSADFVGPPASLAPPPPLPAELQLFPHWLGGPATQAPAMPDGRAVVPPELTLAPAPASGRVAPAEPPPLDALRHLYELPRGHDWSVIAALLACWPLTLERIAHAIGMGERALVAAMASGVPLPGRPRGKLVALLGLSPRLGNLGELHPPRCSYMLLASASPALVERVYRWLIQDEEDAIACEVVPPTAGPASTDWRLLLLSQSRAFRPHLLVFPRGGLSAGLLDARRLPAYSGAVEVDALAYRLIQGTWREVMRTPALASRVFPRPVARAIHGHLLHGTQAGLRARLQRMALTGWPGSAS
ncbi:MAG TPA: hypothetical protein VGD46_11730 [Rhizobacter sp.]